MKTKTKSAKDIVEQIGMSGSIGYYAGFGATLDNLNSARLNQIAAIIKKEIGEKAHDNFVKIVWQIKVLSAENFLANLYALENNNWEIEKVFDWDLEKGDTKKNPDGSDKEKDDVIQNVSLRKIVESESQAFAGIVNHLIPSSCPDQTDAIRRFFRKPLD